MSTFVRGCTSSLPVHLSQKLILIYIAPKSWNESEAKLRACRLPFSRQRIICRKSRNVLPHVYLAPPWGWSDWNFSKSLASENRIPWAATRLVCVMICLAILIEHRLVIDRRTDTGLYNVHRASIAPRGKNWLFNSRMFEHLQYPIYTIQPVVKTVANPVWEPVWEPVWQPVVSCIQTFSRLSNRFDNRFDNRLYRVNGA